jgi:methyl-accepting chemotaxis protein
VRATQEEMQRVNNEMLLQNKAVEATLFVIELLPTGKIIRCCDLFCEYIGYSHQELQSLESYMDLLQDEEEKSRFSLALHDLDQKNILQREVKRHKKSGEVFWLQATYYVIRNSAGVITKIIKIAYDISDKIQMKTIMEENERILKERVKVVQDKGFEQLKKIREKYETQLAEKEAQIQNLLQQIAQK